MIIELNVYNYYTRKLDGTQYGMKVPPMVFVCDLRCCHDKQEFNLDFMVPLFKFAGAGSLIPSRLANNFKQIFTTKTNDIFDVYSSYLIFREHNDIFVDNFNRKQEGTNLLSYFSFCQKHNQGDIWKFLASYTLNKDFGETEEATYNLSRKNELVVKNPAERGFVSQEVLTNLFGLLIKTDINSVLFGNYRDFEIRNPNLE